MKLITAVVEPGKLDEVVRTAAEKDRQLLAGCG